MKYEPSLVQARHRAERRRWLSPEEGRVLLDEIERLREVLVVVRKREHYHDLDHAPCPVCSVIDRALDVP